MQPSTHTLFDEYPARWNRTSRVALVLSLSLHLVAAVAVKTFRGGPAMGFEPVDAVMTVEFLAESVAGGVVPSDDSISRVAPVSTPPPEPAVADSAGPLSPNVSERPPVPAIVTEPQPVLPQRPEQKSNAVAAGRLAESAVVSPASGSNSIPATVSMVAQVGRAGPPPVASGAESNVVGASGPPGVLAKPVYRRNPEPPYPLAARRRRQEGVVLLAVEVTAKGRAARVAVQKSSGFKLLDEAAVRAVQDWEFEPAREGSVGVDSHIEVPVRFRLAE